MSSSYLKSLSYCLERAVSIDFTYLNILSTRFRATVTPFYSYYQSFQQWNRSYANKSLFPTTAILVTSSSDFSHILRRTKI
jgi:hypothetical protein